MTVTAFWWLSLGIALGVAGVVAVLLLLIVRVAERIDRHAQEIWEAGKRIAANTVSIWMVGKTNDIAQEILETVEGIADKAASLDRRVAELAEALRRRGG